MLETIQLLTIAMQKKMSGLGDFILWVLPTVYG